MRIARQRSIDHDLAAPWRRRPTGGPGFILALLALALPASLPTGAAALAVRRGQGPAASATSPKPCGNARRRHCHRVDISSFSWGVGRGIANPTHGAADRQGRTSLGEITVHKPKRKGR